MKKTILAATAFMIGAGLAWAEPFDQTLKSTINDLRPHMQASAENLAAQPAAAAPSVPPDPQSVSSQIDAILKRLPAFKFRLYTGDSAEDSYSSEYYINAYGVDRIVAQVMPNIQELIRSGGLADAKRLLQDNLVGDIAGRAWSYDVPNADLGWKKGTLEHQYALAEDGSLFYGYRYDVYRAADVRALAQEALGVFCRADASLCEAPAKKHWWR